MTATVSSDSIQNATALSRRAMELSHDSGVSLSEGAQHLMRLAEGSAVALELALAELECDRTPSSEREYARLLLRVAINDLATPSRAAGSRRVASR